MRHAAVLLLVALLCNLPCAAEAMSPKEFDSKALPLLDKPSEAAKLLKICDDALASATDANFEAFVRAVKGQAYFLQNEFAKAEAEARKIINSAHHTELGYALSTQALFAMGDYEQGKKMCLEGAKKERNPERKDEAIESCNEIYINEKTLTATTVWQAYKKNTKAATQRYGGKPITLTGTVLSTDNADPKNTRVSLLVDGSKKNLVVCLFPSEEPKDDSDTTTQAAPTGDMQYSLGGNNTSKPKAAQKPSQKHQKNSALKNLPEKGATIMITGTVQGFEGSQLVLNTCSLAE